jgi:hypothetical protein
VMVGNGTPFTPNKAVGLERHRLRYVMEDAVRAMYLQMEHKPASDVAALTPQH